MVIYDLLKFMNRLCITLRVRERVYTGRTRTNEEVVAACCLCCPSQFRYSLTHTAFLYCNALEGGKSVLRVHVVVWSNGAVVRDWLNAEKVCITFNNSARGEWSDGHPGLLWEMVRKHLHPRLEKIGTNRTACISRRRGYLLPWEKLRVWRSNMRRYPALLFILASHFLAHVSLFS